MLSPCTIGAKQGASVMFVPKLSSAASFCSKPCTWPRSSLSRSSASSIYMRTLMHCFPKADPNLDYSDSSCVCTAINNGWSGINIIRGKDNHRHNNSKPIYTSPLSPARGFGSCFRGRFARISLTRFSSSSDSTHSNPSSGPDQSSPGSGGGDGFVADYMDRSRENGVWRGGEINGNDKSDRNPPARNTESSCSKLLTLPTFLTLGRVAAVPLLVISFYINSRWGKTATTSIFIAAAVTDWLDGYLARKMRLGSAFGAFLDPVADKLMVAAALVLLCTRPFQVEMFGEVPWLLTIPSIAIIGREITMSAVREWAASQDGKLLEAVAVNNLGKWKTATQMIAIVILLATRDSSLGTPGPVVAAGVVLLYLSAGLSVWSLGVYMSKIWRVLLK